MIVFALYIMNIHTWSQQTPALQYERCNPQTALAEISKAENQTTLSAFLAHDTTLLENYSGLRAAGGATFEFGIGNFLKVIEYKKFLTCLKNTCLLCILTVPISTLLALLIAVALNSIKWLQKGLQTIFFLPYVTNSIAIGMVFAAMFNIVGSFYGTENELIVTAGIINNVIQFFGGEPINWINYGST